MTKFEELLNDTYRYESGKLRPQGYLLIAEDTNSMYQNIELFYNNKFNNTNQMIPDILLLNILPGEGLKDIFNNWAKAIYGEDVKLYRNFNDTLFYIIYPMLKKLKVRMLIIKDLHNFNNKRKNDDFIFMHTLKNITNNFKIPSILCGNIESEKLLLDEQLLSRYIPIKIKLS